MLEDAAPQPGGTKRWIAPARRCVQSILARFSVRSALAPSLVYLAVSLYVVLFSWLSILRHETFQSNAMDLGYTDQVLWNTMHGRFFRFSTLEGALVDLPLDQIRRTDILLAYHVEPILVPVSLVYLIYDSPVALLVLQSVALGVGAVPAFWLARDHLRSGFAGVVFALAYLLAPAVEGANLSDFHAVSFTPALFLFGFYFLRTDRTAPYLACMLTAVLVKEDISLLVLLLGLYVIFRMGRRRLGAATTLLGLGWFLVCTQIILPHYSGMTLSPFLDRLYVFGSTPKESVLNVARDPLMVIRWLGQREILVYLTGLLSTAGFLPLFAPLILALSAPVLATNVFSTWSWTYSEGAHYSASIVPFLIISGVYGLGFLAELGGRWFGASRAAAVRTLSAAVLLVGGVHHYLIGVSPLARRFYPPRITEHHRLAGELIDLIPDDAALSAQTGLYPHVAHREKAYFFPAVNDAEYVFLDVTASSHPLTAIQQFNEIERLLDEEGFGVVAARDGYLLLQRGRSASPSGELPQSFYSFVLTDDQDVPNRTAVSFGGVLQLVGYDYSLLNVVNAHSLPATVGTYWRALRPLDSDYRVVFFFTSPEGPIVGEYTGEMAAALWYPTSDWPGGQIVRLETPVLAVGTLEDVLVGVTAPGGDPHSADGRLRPIQGKGEIHLVDQERLLRVFSFSEVRR
jgi:uncharacterized membrane protein